MSTLEWLLIAAVARPQVARDRAPVDRRPRPLLEDRLAAASAPAEAVIGRRPGACRCGRTSFAV